MGQNVYSYWNAFSEEKKAEKSEAIRRIEQRLQAKADRKVRDLQREQDRELKELTKWAI